MIYSCSFFPSTTQLPVETWRTVSAFSNTSGGWILCGVAQHGKKFEIEGIENGEKIENDFLTTIRNKDKFNHVLHCEPKKYNVDGKLVLAFYIPSSELKPIWFNTPKNTFIRSGSGDQQANDLEISAIYRDQAFGSQSEKAIEETSFEDINPSSFASYRKRVREENPGFFANDYDDETFCRVTGITKKGLLTYGGLLMFGRFDKVREHCPNFWVDYLEIPGISYSDPAVRYSGYLGILPYVLSNAGTLLSEQEYEALTATLSDKVKTDYTEAREYWQGKRVGWIDKLQIWFYNLYLKSNGVSDGVKDYSGVVSMIMTMDANKRLIKI